MNDMESRQQLESGLQEILVWEKEQKDIFFWEKLGRLPFMLLDRLTPKFIQEKVGEALNEVGGFIQSGGKHLVSQKSVISMLAQTAEGRYEPRQEHGNNQADNGDNFTGSILYSLEDVSRLPIQVMDTTADRITEKRAKFAAAQGAATGFGGLFTIAADIPLVLGQSLKVLQEMALCYGYNPEDPRERIFIVKCMQFASADIVGKKAVLEELAAFDEKEGTEQVFSQIQGWREVVQSYTDSFGMKRLLQMIPIAGIVFGSMNNKGTIQDVAEAGKMLYKKRRITKRLQTLNDPIN